MSKNVHSRLLCTILILSMLVLGIYCEDIRNDSSFSYVSGKITSASLQSADHIADTHAFLEKSSLNLIEAFILIRQASRTFAGLRISQCVLSVLMMIGAYLLSLSFRNSALCTDRFDNMYNQRTLEYIHHNDGKKSHIS